MGASSIAQSQKAIADLSAALSRQEERSQVSANEYDNEEATLASINADIVSLKTQEVKKRSDIKVTTNKLVTDVVRAFVLGASSAQITSLLIRTLVRATPARSTRTKRSAT